jgi:uncharacterized protein YaiI (UPF0178 family)
VQGRSSGASSAGRGHGAHAGPHDERNDLCSDADFIWHLGCAPGRVHIAHPVNARSLAVLEIYIDADACPVKEEIYHVARRYQLRVWVVTNGWLRVPQDPLITRVVVSEGLDRADDWIAERIASGDVAITADVPLADRCVKRGARVIAPDGRAFTESSIGADLATRNLMTALREQGAIRDGGRPFMKQDRSRFLNALDPAIQAIRRTER